MFFPMVRLFPLCTDRVQCFRSLCSHSRRSADYNLRCIVAPYLVNPPLDDDDDCDSVSSTSMTSEVEDDVIERDDYRPHYSTAWLCLKAWHIVPLTSFNAVSHFMMLSLNVVEFR
jgi:hypothetical protein